MAGALNRHQERIAAPEFARLAAKEGHGATLPVIFVFEEALNAFDIGRGCALLRRLRQ